MCSFLKVIRNDSARHHKLQEISSALSKPIGPRSAPRVSKMALRIANAPTAAGRRSVAARAAPPAPQPALARRSALAGLLGGAALLPFSRPALALIPDEEDEELLAKAKANRAERLAKNKETTRAFIADEGFSNKQLEGELIPVQKAVAKLAQSGATGRTQATRARVCAACRPRVSGAAAGRGNAAANACNVRARRGDARARSPAPRDQPPALPRPGPPPGSQLEAGDMRRPPRSPCTRTQVHRAYPPAPTPTHTHTNTHTNTHTRTHIRTFTHTHIRTHRLPAGGR